MTDHGITLTAPPRREGLGEPEEGDRGRERLPRPVEREIGNREAVMQAQLYYRRKKLRQRRRAK